MISILQIVPVQVHRNMTGSDLTSEPLLHSAINMAIPDDAQNVRSGSAIVTYCYGKMPKICRSQVYGRQFWPAIRE